LSTKKSGLSPRPGSHGSPIRWVIKKKLLPYLTYGKSSLIFSKLLLRIIITTIKSKILYGITYASDWIRPVTMVRQNQETFSILMFL
jgi:hypothetical protein